MELFETLRVEYLDKELDGGEIGDRVFFGFRVSYPVMSSTAFYHEFRPDLSAATIDKPAISRVFNLSMLPGSRQSKATKEAARRLRETSRRRADAGKWFVRPIV